MSWFGSILGKAMGTAAAPAVDVIDAVGKAIDSTFTSDEEKAKIAAVLEQLRQRPDELQVELNKIEAAHPSMFVAGWRPAVGWVCVLSLLAYYPPRFIVATWLWVDKVAIDGVWVAPPDVGVTDILGLLAALLGMAGLRSYDKVKGNA